MGRVVELKIKEHPLNLWRDEFQTNGIIEGKLKKWYIVYCLRSYMELTRLEWYNKKDQSVHLKFDIYQIIHFTLILIETPQLFPPNRLSLYSCAARWLVQIDHPLMFNSHACRCSKKSGPSNLIMKILNFFLSLIVS